MPIALLGGALANKPGNGGNAWSRLSWALAFKRLGFDVVFVEQISPEACVDPQGRLSAFESSVNLQYFRDTLSHHNLLAKSCLICDQGRKVQGLSLRQLAALARESSLLFNFGGHLSQPEVFLAAPCRVYYDDDPGYTQFWHASGDPAPRLQDHHLYFTLGRNIGRPECPIPTGAIDWRPTRPPVTLEDWPPQAPVGFMRFTTIASWRGAYAPATFQGKRYGLKAHEFRKVLDLPKRTGLAFEIALQIHRGDDKDLDALHAAGWRIADPAQVAHSPEACRRYTQESSAEFSVAQGVYVETQSGWFSDRTVRYLASARPALVQETGLSGHMPVGEGLLTFRTLEEAVEGAHRIVRDYPRHCRAARRLAMTHFDATAILQDILKQAGVQSP